MGNLKVQNTQIAYNIKKYIKYKNIWYSLSISRKLNNCLAKFHFLIIRISINMRSLIIISFVCFPFVFLFLCTEHERIRDYSEFLIFVKLTILPFDLLKRLVDKVLGG